MTDIQKEIDMYGIPGQRPAFRAPNTPREDLETAADLYSSAEAIENALDSALAETFPASDPISISQPAGGCSGNQANVVHDDAAVCRLIELNANRRTGF